MITKKVYEGKKSKVIVHAIIEQTRKKTKTYIIIKSETSDGDYPLGVIKWHSAWRRYCFFPDAGTLWDSGCLEEISSFMKEINAKHKKEIIDKRKKDIDAAVKKVDEFSQGTQGKRMR